MNIDQLNEPIGKSTFFKWIEAIHLLEWGVFVLPPDEKVLKEIEKTALVMDLIRHYFKRPIIIRSWYRPEKYNVQIKGAKNSRHILGKAVDFVVKDFDCDVAREWLAQESERLDIRIENLPGSNWVHIDTDTFEGMAKEKRFFRP